MPTPMTPMAPPPDKCKAVIKLKHGNTLRRIVGPFAHYNMSKLRAKIVTLFNFKPDADFDLTYTEKDGKVIVLEKDSQLHNAVVCQRLNPLRINVTLRTATVTTSIAINGQLQENDMSTLRAKIVKLCNLDPDSDFFLTYTDEDGEVVTLEDNEELRDVITQHLHPLIMNVMLRNDAKSKELGSTAKLTRSFFDHPMGGLLAHTKCVDCPRKKVNGKPVAASGSTSYQYPELDFHAMPLRPSPFQGISNASMRQMSSSSYGQFPGNILSPIDQLRRGSSSFIGPPGYTPSQIDQLLRGSRFPPNHPDMSSMYPMSRSYNANAPLIPNAGATCYNANAPLIPNAGATPLIPNAGATCYNANAPLIPNAGATCHTCMFPITEPFFKKMNGYPLCSYCASMAGNDSHYTKIIEPNSNGTCSRTDRPRVVAEFIRQCRLPRKSFDQTGEEGSVEATVRPAGGELVDNASSSVPSVNIAPSSVTSVDNAPSSSAHSVDNAIVSSVDNAPPAVLSTDDAPPAVSSADGGNEMEWSDNDWDSLHDELEEMGFPDTELNNRS